MYRIAKDDIDEGRTFWTGYSWINGDDPHRVPKLYTEDEAKGLIERMKRLGYDVKLDK